MALLGIPWRWRAKAGQRNVSGMDELTEDDLSGLLPPHRAFAAEFLRVRAFVERRIKLGVPATAIHRELKERGQITFSARTLQRYLAQARERG